MNKTELIDAIAEQTVYDELIGNETWDLAPNGPSNFGSAFFSPGIVLDVRRIKPTEVAMKYHKVAIVFLAILGSVIACHSYAGDAEDRAVKAAEDWLALVDSGEYTKNWNQSAEYFKNAVTQEQWAQSLDAVRKPLGEVVSRKKQSAQYATSLPGAPDGEYVVISFATRFTNKESAIETVTPMKDPDGEWRVSGYYIK